jgi:ferredoxin
MHEAVWLPQIDRDSCTGCGDCLPVCPTHAIGLINGKAAVIQAEACAYCGACEAICPVSAIALPYQIVAAQTSSLSGHSRN